MKKMGLILGLCMVIVFSCLLAGCGEKPPEEPTISASYCLGKESYEKSVRGKSILYYYANGSEVVIYYSNKLKNGYVSCRRYFATKSAYELERDSGNWDKAVDAEKMLLKKRAVSFSDMDAFYDEIENSLTYTMVK